MNEKMTQTPWSVNGRESVRIKKNEKRRRKEANEGNDWVWAG